MMNASLLFFIVTSQFLLVFFISNISYAFSESSNQTNLQITQVLKTDKVEEVKFPYTSSNSDRKNPVEYIYDSPKDKNWILSIVNNQTYYDVNGAKTVIKLKEKPPSEKFLEIGMYGNESRLWVGVNTNTSGYIRLYETNSDGWSKNDAIIIGHANNQGLTINNGKRIIIDRLSVEGFNLDSISVYGKDESSSPDNTYGGSIFFSLMYGDPKDSPIYYVPIGMIIGVFGILAILLIRKKRDPKPKT